MKKIAKFFYNFFPFKKELFTIIKLFYKPGQNIYKHLHFKGKISVKVENLKSFLIYHYGYMVENDLFWAGITGGWEKVSLKYWIQLAKISDVIIDVGANTGVYALAAKTVKPQAMVFAFEPIERNFSKLLYNCELNKYKIECEQKALSNNDGKAVVFEDKKEGVIYSVTVNKSLVEMTERVEKTEIETIRLDTYIKQKNIPKVDLIKIDVETHEPEVLEGFGEYLLKYQPTMLIEILNTEVAEKVQHIIRDIPYLYFNIDEENSIRRVNKITKSDYFNFLICKQEIAEKLNLL